MHCKDFLVNYCCDREAVEAIRKRFPKFYVVPSLALIVKSIDAVDGGAFVVSTQNEEVLWVFDLVGKEEADCLQRLLASVNVVSKEEIIRFGWETAIFEEAEKIIILAMYVATDLTADIY